MLAPEPRQPRRERPQIPKQRVNPLRQDRADQPRTHAGAEPSASPIIASRPTTVVRSVTVTAQPQHNRQSLRKGLFSTHSLDGPLVERHDQRPARSSVAGGVG